MIHHNLICGVIYRHPKSNIEAFLNSLNDVLDKINRENKYCVIMGDFNINLLNSESHPATDEFLSNLGTYFFNLHILKPTRITHYSATLIDNIFFNAITHHTISSNIIHDLTDHLPNFLIINKFSTLPRNFKLYRRDYSHFNESNFLSDIQSINWHQVLAENNDVNSLFSIFYSKLSVIVDNHIPLKQMSKREIKCLSKPWITPAIKKSFIIKNKLYKMFIKTKSLYYHNKFKYYRNKLKLLIKKSKIDYYHKYFNNNKTNVKNIWRGIKKIISLKPMNSNIPSKILKNNIELIANLLLLLLMTFLQTSAAVYLLRSHLLILPQWPLCTLIRLTVFM